MTIKEHIGSIVGPIFRRLHNLWVMYNTDKVSGYLGGTDRIIQYPFHISGIENIEAGPSINIGQQAMIMTTRAKLKILGHFVSGPGLTIITGDHMQIIGRYIDEVSVADKNRLDTGGVYDKDVIIEEDVWCGANVTILKGVTIGRGCIIAAGAVVTRSIPPYSIAGGVPSKVIKKRFNANQIIEHEKSLYNEEKRLTKESIEKLML